MQDNISGAVRINSRSKAACTFNLSGNTMKTIPTLLLTLTLSATAFAAPVTNAKGEEVFLFD